MKTILLIVLILTASAHAHECDNAIKKHISEAIAHNKKVASVYARLTDGQSEKLSFTLINLEHVTKLFVGPIEKEARLYHEHNIPVICEEIPSMEAMPAFQEKVSEELRPQTFYKYDRKSLTQSLIKLMDQNKFDEAYNLVADDLEKLESAPNQQCLTRHFLESIALTLKLRDRRQEESSRAGLPDPTPLIKKYIVLQSRALLLTTYLDKQAFPLQKDGLLIYCQDVPSTDWK